MSTMRDSVVKQCKMISLTLRLYSFHHSFIITCLNICRDLSECFALNAALRQLVIQFVSEITFLRNIWCMHCNALYLLFKQMFHTLMLDQQTNLYAPSHLLKKCIVCSTVSDYVNVVAIWESLLEEILSSHSKHKCQYCHKCKLCISAL